MLHLLPFVLSKTQNQCILVPLPSSLQRYHLLNNSENTEVAIKNFIVKKVQYSTSLHYIIPHISPSSQDQVNINSATNCSEVVGVIGDVDSKTAGIIHTVAKRSILNITLVSAVTPTTFLPLVNVNLPTVLDMNPLIHYIHALIGFTNQLNWTRVGLISDGTYYYETAAELLQKLMSQSGKPLVPYIRMKKNSILQQVFQTIQEYETRIIIISMNRLAACSLLEEARKMNFNWPSYGWLILDSESGIGIQSTCNVERVIMVKDFSVKMNSTGKTDQKIASSILLDSIFAVTLASQGMQISNASFEGSTGLVQFRSGNRLNNISVVQVRNGSELEIARYVSDTQWLELIENILEPDAPRGSVLIIRNENSTIHNVLFGMLTFFVAAFVTVIFVLYLLFRNEPEIKATSVPISISMFLGCYLLLSYTPVLLVKAYPDSRVAVPHAATCHFIAWLGGTGIPFPLILATILAKMLRVYAIIQRPLSYKKKLFTNYMLLLYIILMLFPTVLILTLWSSIDPLILVMSKIPTKQGLQILELCLSTHTTIWLIIPYVYTAILIAAVVVVGIKSSSIRYIHFKDTNATNSFVLIAIAAAIMGNLYGYLFVILQLSGENRVASEMCLSLSSLGIIISCQAFLFLPKVYFPVKRWLHRNKVKKKTVSFNTTTINFV